MDCQKPIEIFMFSFERLKIILRTIIYKWKWLKDVIDWDKVRGYIKFEIVLSEWI